MDGFPKKKKRKKSISNECGFSIQSKEAEKARHKKKKKKKKKRKTGESHSFPIEMAKTTPHIKKRNEQGHLNPCTFPTRIKTEVDPLRIVVSGVPDSSVDSIEQSLQDSRPISLHQIACSDNDDNSSISSVDSDILSMMADLKQQHRRHKHLTAVEEVDVFLSAATNGEQKIHPDGTRKGKSSKRAHKYHSSSRKQRREEQSSVLVPSAAEERKQKRKGTSKNDVNVVAMEIATPKQSGHHSQDGAWDEQERSTIEDDSPIPMRIQNGNANPISYSKRNRFLAHDDNNEEAIGCYHDDDDDTPDPYERLHQVWESVPKNLEEEIGPWRKGKWSNEELKLLHSNVTKYMKKFHITNIHEFVSEGQFKQTNFFKFVAKGINRTIFTVYQKVRLFYNDENYGGIFTKDEDKQLLRLQLEMGNKWTQIGLKLGRSGDAVRHRYYYTKGKSARGKWSTEEEEKLKKAVLSAFRYVCPSSEDDGEVGDGRNGPCVDRCPLDAPLPASKTWDMISEEVGTRSAEQCRQKWFYNLCWVMGRSGAKWTLRDDVALVEKVSLLNVDCEPLIDWQALADGWPQARSGYYLRKKWNSLIRFVPNSVVMDFPELLDYLNEFRVPVWKKNIEQDVIDSSTCSDDEMSNF